MEDVLSAQKYSCFIRFIVWKFDASAVVGSADFLKDNWQTCSYVLLRNCYSALFGWYSCHKSCSWQEGICLGVLRACTTFLWFSSKTPLELTAVYFWAQMHKFMNHPLFRCHRHVGSNDFWSLIDTSLAKFTYCVESFLLL